MIRARHIGFKKNRETGKLFEITPLIPQAKLVFLDNVLIAKKIDRFWPPF